MLYSFICFFFFLTLHYDAVFIFVFLLNKHLESFQTIEISLHNHDLLNNQELGKKEKKIIKILKNKSSAHNLYMLKCQIFLNVSGFMNWNLNLKGRNIYKIYICTYVILKCIIHTILFSLNHCKFIAECCNALDISEPAQTYTYIYYIYTFAPPAFCSKQRFNSVFSTYLLFVFYFIFYLFICYHYMLCCCT